MSPIHGLESNARRRISGWRTGRVCGLITTGTITCLSLGASVAAQTEIDLATFTTCETDGLIALERARFGDSDGSGIIESNATRVAFDPVTQRYAVYTVAGTRVMLYDRSGNFIRSVLRQGSGPGEVQRIMHVEFAGGRIIVQDSRGSKWLQLDADGQILIEARMTVRAGPFVALPGGDTLIVGSIDPGPEAVGFPLHLLSLSGDSVKHFGSSTGDWNAARPYAGEILVASGETGQRTVWWANKGQLHFEEWSFENEIRRVVSGEPPWFRVVTNRADSDERPETRMADFVVDGQDRIWVLSRVADSRWSEVAAQSVSNPEGAIFDLDGYFDIRLDVFDVPNQTHFGPRIWDQSYAYLVQGRNISDGTHVTVVQYDGLTPQAVLYAFELSQCVDH